MRYCSQVDFSKLVGVTRQGVYKAVKLGFLIADSDRCIDLLEKRSMQFAEKHVLKLGKSEQTKFHKIFKAAKLEPEKRGPEPLPAPVGRGAPTIGLRKPTNLNTEIDLDADGLPDNLSEVTKADIDIIKSIEQVRKLKFELAEKRNKFVPKELIKKVFSKLYAIDKAEFIALSAGSAPEIAGICGIEDPEKIVEINQYLDEKFYQVLNHIKREIDDFLKRVDT